MMHELSTEALARKNPRGRDYHSGVRLSNQACRLLHCSGLAGTRHTCYSCNWRRDCLPDLEEEARLQLVKQEGVHV